ncbi:hypothetical protein [Bradyrhizobium sp. JYMT SZCCT0180]|uniref:hypothetical protein n=1 Tax=Bradyrhizobium sp. JYMT SZCCT0180 TaxID=2807666 RepID=UPI001BA9984A|nr:hypothetical protein [Bradyrhizobium sp. JYMT SZCCT0180]MBR1209480.1 hypothetical protein [Bradyrhizobium sp. JYMT SZCCT0180]
MSIDTADDDDYLAAMSDQDIDRSRGQAEECQLQAERSVREADKEAWLRMAGEWTKLAQDAERRRGL